MTPRQRFTSVLFCFMAGMGLLCSIAGQFSGTFWISNLLAQFQIWAFFGGMLFFAIALVDFLKPALVLSALLMLSSGYAISPVILHELNAPMATGPSVKIINYNVLSTSPHQEVIDAWIREQQPDVIALVEGNYRWADTVAGLKDILPYSLLLDNTGNVGIILLSKYPLQNQQYRQMTEPFFWPMMSVDIDLPVGLTRFIIAHSPTPVSSENLRMGRIQLRGFGELAGASELPVVLMGDFNTTPWTKPYIDVMREHQLYGNKLTASWPSGMYAFGIPIDQIVAGKGAVVSNITTGPTHYSDHRARVAELRIIR